MPIDWILSPLGLYTLVAVALIGCLGLFVSMKVQIALVRRSFHQNSESARTASEAALAALGAEFTTLGAELVTLRQQMETAATTFSSGQELNLTRRAQALRMQHRGEPAATIAAALRVPRNEIDLLLKIQKLPGV